MANFTHILRMKETFDQVQAQTTVVDNAMVSFYQSLMSEGQKFTSAYEKVFESMGAGLGNFLAPGFAAITSLQAKAIKGSGVLAKSLYNAGTRGAKGLIGAKNAIENGLLTGIGTTLSKIDVLRNKAAKGIAKGFGQGVQAAGGALAGLSIKMRGIGAAVVRSFPKAARMAGAKKRGGKASKKQKVPTAIPSFGGAIDGAVDIISSSVLETARYSDAMQDAKRATGMTAKELEQLQKIRTRTSDIELLGMAKEAAEAGLAKQQVLGFVQAADKIKLTMGDAFGGDIGTMVGTFKELKANFPDAKGLDLGEFTEKFSSLTLALSQGGESTSANLIEMAKGAKELGALSPGIAQLSAIGATLEEVGIKAPQATSSLKSIMGSMQQNPAGFSKVLGMTNEGFQEMLSKNPGQLLNDLIPKLGGMQTPDLKSLNITDKNAVDTLLKLAENTDAYKNNLKLANNEMANATAINKTYKDSNSTLGASLDIAKKAGTRLMVSLGKMLAPAIEWVAKKFEQAANYIDKNWDSVQPILIGVGVALGLMALSMIAFNIAAMANPVGAVIAGIALLATGIAFLYQKFEPFREQVNAIWNNIKAFGSAIAEIFISIKNDIMDALGLGGAGGSLQFFNTLFGILGLVVRTIIDNVLMSIRGLFTGIAIAIKWLLLPFQVVRNIILSVYHLLTGNTEKAKAHFFGAFQAIANFFITTFQRIKTFFGDVFGGIVERTRSILELIGLVKKEKEKEEKIDISKNTPQLPESYPEDVVEANKAVKEKTEQTGVLGGTTTTEQDTGSGATAPALQPGLQEVSAGSVKEKNYHISFESFVKGGLNISSDTIKESVSELEDEFMNMFLRVLNNTQQI